MLRTTAPPGKTRADYERGRNTGNGPAGGSVRKKTIAACAARALRDRILRRCSSSRGHASLAVVIVLALLQALIAHAQPPVLQRGYNAGATGATLSETTLNTSNVVPGSFGLVFKLSVDDNVMAQPLYVPNVTIGAKSHNVVYVATMSDTLYA